MNGKWPSLSGKSRAEQEQIIAEMNADRQRRIDADEVKINGKVVGQLSALPKWARRYIKDMRTSAYPSYGLPDPIFIDFGDE